MHWLVALSIAGGYCYLFVSRQEQELFCITCLWHMYFNFLVPSDVATGKIMMNGISSSLYLLSFVYMGIASSKHAACDVLGIIVTALSDSW